MRIEILHQRDPDSACDVSVWVDGVKLPHDGFTVESIDPGAGYDPDDFEEMTEEMRTAEVEEGTEGMTESFRNAVIEARQDAMPAVEHWAVS